MEKNNNNNLQQFLTEKRTLAPIPSEPWTKLEVSFLLIQSYNDLVSLFFLVLTQASPPFNLDFEIFHSIFVKGGQTNFEIDPSFEVEASQLYHDVKYTPVDEFLNQFV